MNINDTLILPRASRYPNPLDGSEILPVVYGDFKNSIYPNNHLAGGCTTAVCIDRLNLVYCANALVSASDELPFVYVDNVLQSPSVYTWYAADNYLGLGWISTLRFSVNPGNSRVSLRMRGMLDDNGDFMNDPLSALKHFFIKFGSWVDSDFDAASFRRGGIVENDLHYAVHWQFDHDDTYNNWLSIFAWYLLADFSVTQAHQLAITIDPGIRATTNVWWHFDAALDCVGDDPEDNPELVASADDIVTEVTYKFNYSWSSQTFGIEENYPNAQLTAQYGAGFPRVLEFPGVRDSNQLGSLNFVYFFHLHQQGVLPAVPATVTFTVRTARVVHLTPGAFVTLTWRFGPHPLGLGWTQRLLKVISTTLEVSAADQRITFRCLDTQLFYQNSTYLLMVDRVGSPWSFFFSDSGEADTSQTIPMNTAVNPTTPYAWVRLLDASAGVWYLSLSADGELTRTSAQPSGAGTTAIITLINRLMQTWQLSVSNTTDEFYTRQVV